MLNAAYDVHVSEEYEGSDHAYALLLCSIDNRQIYQQSQTDVTLFSRVGVAHSEYHILQTKPCAMSYAVKLSQHCTANGIAHRVVYLHQPGQFTVSQANEIIYRLSMHWRYKTVLLHLFRYFEIPAPACLSSFESDRVGISAFSRLVPDADEYERVLATPEFQQLLNVLEFAIQFGAPPGERPYNACVITGFYQCLPNYLLNMLKHLVQLNRIGLSALVLVDYMEECE